jgi:hypothetical protein
MLGGAEEMMLLNVNLIEILVLDFKMGRKKGTYVRLGGALP